MARTDRLSNYRTTVAADADGVTHVTYVRTQIVSWDADQITLRTGGWDTVTTRRKMNQTSRQFALGYSVWREKGDTYVRRPDGSVVDLDDGMTFPRR